MLDSDLNTDIIWVVSMELFATAAVLLLLMRPPRGRMLETMPRTEPQLQATDPA